MRLFANADYPFLEWRRRAYLVSGLMLVLGIGAMIYNTANSGSWLNYGVDFAGGTLVHVDFEGDVSVDQIRAVDPTWSISRFGEVGENEFVIRSRTFSDNVTTGASEQVEQRLVGTFGEGSFQVVRTESVGPTVGAELQERALIAILISFLLTLVYLAVRFQWRFGVAAVIATAHDIIVTLGFLALLRSEISVGTVAAFLTIVGYSLNDTIIVFDRIRENLQKQVRGTSFMQLMNRSINETLPRTVLTSGTTLATLAALYLFGGAVIRDFALVLILGIGIGTFSSVFVASPALYAIDKKWPSGDKKAGPPPSRSGRRETVTV